MLKAHIKQHHVTLLPEESTKLCGLRKLHGSISCMDCAGRVGL